MTTPKRWQEIDRISAAALERDSVARAAFLDEACGADEQLRKEVESLLAHDVPESLVLPTAPTNPTSAEYIVTEIKRHRLAFIVSLLVLAAV